MRIVQNVIVIIGVMAVMASPLYGRPPIRKAFFNVYPGAENGRLDDVPSNSGHCGACHFDFNGGGPRNPYGLAVQVAINSGNFASDEAAIQSVENEDSDNDGYSNLIEITDVVNFTNTPTFPGLTSSNVGGVSNVTLTDIQDYLTPTGSNDTIPPSVSVVYPNGGENLNANSVATIMWSASDASGIGRVDIFLSDDAGVSFKPIAVGEVDDGLFDWFVPNRPGSQNIIRVAARDNAGNWGADWTDGQFNVTGLPAGHVPTTLRDMDLPGSQPLTVAPLDNPDVTCVTCHGNYNTAVEPWYNWKGSMMAQAMRDPLFAACVAVAEQDAPSVGDLCLRCHTPGGWLEGRSVDTGGGLVTAKDRQGVQCDFCHRLVDPVYAPGISPPEDQDILDSLLTAPLTTANGQFVIDPNPIRRGPYADPAAAHAFLDSDFHRKGNVCGTCHDVSSPVFSAGATPRDYVPNAFDTPHASGDPRDMLPIERTFSEWSVSEYATTGVFAPQFAGNKPDGIVSSCQDCHMADVAGKGCGESGVPNRSDLGQHDLTGGNTCVPDMVAAMYPAEVDVNRLNDGKLRAIAMLERAATLAITPGQAGARPILTVTVTNESAHKLPSGYPEGRRIWLNVKAYDDQQALIYESGAYNPTTAVLTHDEDAKIYQIKPGISYSLSPVVGLAPGPSFHFVVNDTFFLDNRIPPRGFTNAAFETIQSPPIDYAYADGQYWDETLYQLPYEAVFAEVTLFYQTTSKDYVEFLRDENVTTSAGQELYDAWEAAGKCPPVVMAHDTTSLSISVTGVDGQAPKLTTALLASAPNPFTTGTSIRYSLSNRQPVTISIYDVSGRLVQTLVDEMRPEGFQSAFWNGTNNHGEPVASGVYYSRMRAAGFEATRKIVRIK